MMVFNQVKILIVILQHQIVVNVHQNKMKKINLSQQVTNDKNAQIRE
jgi:hypothetical protein